MSTQGQICKSCGTSFPELALLCPSCQRLVHSEELRRLSQSATAAEKAGELGRALQDLRTALTLLPPEARQYAQLNDKALQLSAALENSPIIPAQGAPARNDKKGLGGALSALGVLLWKFKVFAFFLLTKLKFLLLGLTKLPTLLSMLFTLGIYFSIWGWKFALGFVLSIYVHEMGHVAALSRLGIAASAPMFVPGFGAYVRMHQYPTTPAEDARVGLAGPLWGLGAALACLFMYRTTGAGIWGALTYMGASLNLFNLLPVWQLDGARGFHALDKRQRLVVTGVLFGAWFFTQQFWLMVLAAVSGYRWHTTDPRQTGDQRAFFEYTFLVVALSALLRVQVPTP